MLHLPEEFLQRMKKLLGSEYDAFYACYSQNPLRALRVNSLKISTESFQNRFPYSLQKTPFCKESFFVEEAFQNPGRHPLHHAGAFYMQEPSAASVVTVLNPQPNDKVLDLCAAPGGKSTQIAAALQGTGLLWSNEIVRKRAKILLSNVERMGIRNSVVSSCHPEALSERLAVFFDKILVDAPCSGEGMFRRDEQAAAEWSEEHVKTCALRQLSILQSAKRMLCPGGVLVYSTCTFSIEENEEVIFRFLKENPDFILERIDVPFGRPGFAYGQEALSYTRRIFPMDGGEGHFIARLRKTEGKKEKIPFYQAKQLPSEMRRLCEKMLKEVLASPVEGILSMAGDTVLWLPEGLPELKGLTILRAGLALGNIRKNRIEPAHALFLAAQENDLYKTIDFSSDSIEIEKFLRGEEIEVPSFLKGYTGVSVEHVVTGFGKASNGMLKNHYPKGLRNI